MRNTFFLVVIVSILAGCKSGSSVDKIELPFYNEETFTAEWINEDDAEYESIHTIADFEFIDQEGRKITNESFDGKVYVANFFFTLCPTVCPKMEANLSLVQDEFKGNGSVKILSHTVMPWADSVERLKEYAIQNDIDADQWHLVTGKQEDLYSMGRLSYFVDEGFGKGVTDIDDFLHTENMVLIDQQRRIRGIYNGTLKLEMRRMIADINDLLND